MSYPVKITATRISEDKNVFRVKGRGNKTLTYSNGMIYIRTHDEEDKVIKTRILHEYWCDVELIE